MNPSSSPHILKEAANPNSLVTDHDDGKAWSLGLLEWSNIIKYFTLEEFYKCARLCHYIGDNIHFYSYVLVLPLWESRGSNWPISISRCGRVATRFPFLQQIVCRCGTVTNCDTALERVATYLLPELKHLRLLDLRGCSLTGDGAEVLAEELPACPSLRELRLGSNDIGSNGAKSLSSSIERIWRRVTGRRGSAVEQAESESEAEHGGGGNSGGGGGNGGGGGGGGGDGGGSSSKSSNNGSSSSSTKNVEKRRRSRQDSSDENPIVHTLDISSNDIGDEGVAAFGKLLESGVPLRGLDVWGNGIGAKALCELCGCVSRRSGGDSAASSLRRLDIGRNQVSGAVLGAVVDVLRSGARLEHLGIEQTFHSGVYAHRTTSSSSGDGGGRQVSIAAVISAVAECPTLTSLDFTGHGIFAEEISMLITSLTHYSSNRSGVASSRVTSSRMTSSRAKAFGATSSTSLNYHPTLSSSARSLSSNNCRIRDLFLGSNRLGDDGSELLATAIESGGLGKSLRALGLSCNEITSKGGRLLILSYMKEPSKIWRLLDLSHNNIGRDVIRGVRSDAERLGDMLDRDKVLKKLDISRNPCVQDLRGDPDGDGGGTGVGEAGGGGGGGDGGKGEEEEDEEEDEEDDDFGGNVIPNLWSFSAWFGPSQTNDRSKVEPPNTPTRRRAKRVRKRERETYDWIRSLRSIRGVVIVSSVESTPGGSKLHGLSLHTWQGRLRKQLSNFKGLESETYM